MIELRKAISMGGTFACFAIGGFLVLNLYLKMPSSPIPDSLKTIGFFTYDQRMTYSPTLVSIIEAFAPLFAGIGFGSVYPSKQRVCAYCDSPIKGLRQRTLLRVTRKWKATSKIFRQRTVQFCGLDHAALYLQTIEKEEP